MPGNPWYDPLIFMGFAGGSMAQSRISKADDPVFVHFLASRSERTIANRGRNWAAGNCELPEFPATDRVSKDLFSNTEACC